MKHTLKITIYLVLLFIFAQVAGLIVTSQHIPHIEETSQGGYVLINASAELAFDTPRPETRSSAGTLIYILSALVIGTILLLILIRFRQKKIWKTWFFLAVVMCITYSLASFIDDRIAIAIALLFAYFKIIRQNIIIHNISEVLIYGALGAIFVPMEYMNIYVAFALLFAISLYDMFAVWRSKHMVKLATFQSESNVFAGLMIPYHQKKESTLKEKSAAKEKSKIHTTPHAPKKAVNGSIQSKTAILGGGDIAFPLLFSGVVLKDLSTIVGIKMGLALTAIITVFAAAALLLLLLKAKKGKFYPAMPFISAGCIFGYLILVIIRFVF